MNILATIYLLAGVAMTHAQVMYQPEQVHISYGEKPSEMVVAWVTGDDTTTSMVEFGMLRLDQKAVGVSHQFKDGGSEKRIMYMHKVTLTGLVAGQIYRYHCGSTLGWSGIYFFHAMRTDRKWGPKFLLYGDMGNINAQSLPRIQEEILSGNVDFVMHSGDFAYDMDTYNARTGDEFMRQIEPIAAYVPYMTCAGNHEHAYNFSNYKNRFFMPRAQGDGNSMWYSFNVGPIHFINWASDLYYFTQYGTEQIDNQYAWMERDLQEANSRINRTLHPWIVSVTHRPMYCSNSNDRVHCLNINNTARVGNITKGWRSPETLLYKYGVDLIIGAHEHSYERMWPVYDRRVCNGSRTEPYINPRAPVHVITGSAGCQEGLDPFVTYPVDWSAVHYDDYGYNRIQVANSSHLFMDYVSDDKGGKVIDSMTLIKDVHGAGLYNCHRN